MASVLTYVMRVHYHLHHADVQDGAEDRNLKLVFRGLLKRKKTVPSHQPILVTMLD